MKPPPPTVFLVDDDPVLAKAIGGLLTAAGFVVRIHTSSPEFLATYDPDAPGCVILDMVMPDLDGLAVQRMLRDKGCRHPIIFLTGEGNVPNAVEALKAGAVDFLGKPFDGDHLIAAVHAAIRRDADLRLALRQEKLKRSQIEALTPREREVLGHVISGLLNKEIAGEVGISERTVKFHRANLMNKLGAESVADLVRLATELGATARELLKTRPVPEAEDAP